MRLFAALLFVTSSMAWAETSGKYVSVFENDIVAVQRLELAPAASVPVFHAAHDGFWVSLTESTVTFSSQQGKIAIDLQPGDTRFFPSFDSQSLTNIGSSEFRGVLVTLKPRSLVSGCECTGATGKSVCGCKGADHLASLWAFSLGNVTLAGTSLGADEAFRAASVRDDMLLVAITDLTLIDQAGGDADSGINPSLRLKSGEAVWIRGGAHQFKNVGERRARFVTFEF